MQEGGIEMVDQDPETLTPVSEPEPPVTPEQQAASARELALIEGLPIEQAIEQVRKRALLIRKITEAAVAESLYPSDWIEQGGKMFLAGSGAERLFKWMMKLGFQLRDVDMDRKERTDKDGSYYIYFAKGIAKLLGTELYVEGSCSARDQFFTTRYEGSGTERKRIMLPSDEVDEGNIRKSALTNLYSNAVTRLLGIRGLDRAAIKAMGFDETKFGKVEYGSKKGGAPAATQPPVTVVPAAAPQGTWVASLRALLLTAAPIDSARTSILKSVTAGPYTDRNGKAATFEGWASIDAIEKRPNAEAIAKMAYGKLKAHIEQSLGAQHTEQTTLT
jgi:hypothetical protein